MIHHIHEIYYRSKGFRPFTHHEGTLERIARKISALLKQSVAVYLSSYITASPDITTKDLNMGY